MDSVWESRGCCTAPFHARRCSIFPSSRDLRTEKYYGNILALFVHHMTWVKKGVWCNIP